MGSRSWIYHHPRFLFELPSQIATGSVALFLWHRRVSAHKLPFVMIEICDSSKKLERKHRLFLSGLLILGIGLLAATVTSVAQTLSVGEHELRFDSSGWLKKNFESNREEYSATGRPGQRYPTLSLDNNSAQKDQKVTTTPSSVVGAKTSKQSSERSSNQHSSDMDEGENNRNSTTANSTLVFSLNASVAEQNQGPKNISPEDSCRRPCHSRRNVIAFTHGSNEPGFGAGLK